MYQERTYRQLHTSELRSFNVQYEACDLWLAIDSSHYEPVIEQECQQFIRNKWLELSAYVDIDTTFAETLCAYQPPDTAPATAKHMAHAAQKASVGPMAAVAGCFAQDLGLHLVDKFGLENIIIENGGDIWLRSTTERTIALYAGNSPLSGKIALAVPPTSALGICTSSGTVGHSLSFGKADAVTVLAHDAALADAFATAIANRILAAEDITAALADLHEEILACVIILGEHIGVKGNIKLKNI